MERERERARLTTGWPRWLAPLPLLIFVPRRRELFRRVGPFFSLLARLSRLCVAASLSLFAVYRSIAGGCQGMVAGE